MSSSFPETYEFNIRASHNVEKRYLQGAFGALPSPRKTHLRSMIAALQEARSHKAEAASWARDEAPDSHEGRRGQGNRRSQTTVGILCQGMVTEKQYFDRLKELLNWSHVQIVHQKTAKDPKGLLAEAKKKSQLDGGLYLIDLL